MFKRSLIIGLTVLMAVGLSTVALADTEIDTEIQVEYETPNPDLHLSVNVDNQVRAWADVSGSGTAAVGEIRVIGSRENGATAAAWQTADFENGSYTATVGASYEDFATSTFSGSQDFEVENADTASIEQEISSQATPRILDSSQEYEATGADSVMVGGSISREWGEWSGPQSVTYTGNAEGDVSGSQGSWNRHWQSDNVTYGVGYGARISGTEGTTHFDFVMNTPPQDGFDPGTLHTVVIAHEGTAFGEAKTWTEDSPLDADFDWIEPTPLSA